MPRYLLQQWTQGTVRQNDKAGAHGEQLEYLPSSSSRLQELTPGDVVYVAAVRDGHLMPICRAVVESVTTERDLLAAGVDPYELPWQVVAATPLPRLNLRQSAPRQLGLDLRTESGQPLARRKGDPRSLDGQSFRSPQWIDQASAKRLDAFLDNFWNDEDAGLGDPERLARGQGARRSAAERRAIELCAMRLAQRKYERRGYEVTDTSATHPYDLRAVKAAGADEVHVEVKGTTGARSPVLITAGEEKHARSWRHCALVVVSGIRLKPGRRPTASGGTVAVIDPWLPRPSELDPTVYRHTPSFSGS